MRYAFIFHAQAIFDSARFDQYFKLFIYALIDIIMHHMCGLLLDLVLDTLCNHSYHKLGQHNTLDKDLCHTLHVSFNSSGNVSIL